METYSKGFIVTTSLSMARVPRGTLSQELQTAQLPELRKPSLEWAVKTALVKGRHIAHAKHICIFSILTRKQIKAFYHFNTYSAALKKYITGIYKYNF